MSTEIDIKSPKRLPNLKLVATLTALIAVGIVATGIVGRAHAKQEMTTWSAEQAVPTVVAYTPSTGGDGATLVLPAICPHSRARRSMRRCRATCMRGTPISART